MASTKTTHERVDEPEGSDPGRALLPGHRSRAGNDAEGARSPRASSEHGEVLAARSATVALGVEFPLHPKAGRVAQQAGSPGALSVAPHPGRRPRWEMPHMEGPKRALTDPPAGRVPRALEPGDAGRRRSTGSCRLHNEPPVRAGEQADGLPGERGIRWIGCKAGGIAGG